MIGQQKPFFRHDLARYLDRLNSLNRGDLTPITFETCGDRIRSVNENRSCNPADILSSPILRRRRRGINGIVHIRHRCAGASVRSAFAKAAARVFFDQKADGKMASPK
jgi:hypothetical protein